MKKHDIRIAILIFVLITLVLIYLFKYVFPKTCPQLTLIPLSTPKSTPVFTVDYKTGFQTYISNTDKFTIGYSKDWKASSVFSSDSHANLILVSDKFPEIFSQMGDGGIYISTTVKDKDLSLLDWLKNEDEKRQNNFPEYYPYKEIEINNLPVVTSEIFWTQDFINRLKSTSIPSPFDFYFPIGTVEKTVYFQNDDLVITINGLYSTNTNAFLRELNQIISTLKFIQPYQ